MNGYAILSSAVSASIEIMMKFFFFGLLIW